jgi:4'-phosphopantetheinyl transferase
MSVPATTLYPVLIPVPEDTQALKGRDKVAALSRLAREALTQSCEKSGLKLDGYPKGENGAPIPVDGVHWSVSHKAGIVGGVAAPLPIGLDLETIRPVSDGMMAKVAGDAEWRQVAGDRQRIFFRFWTAKEAVLKAAGIGRFSHDRGSCPFAGRPYPRCPGSGPSSLSTRLPGHSISGFRDPAGRKSRIQMPPCSILHP